MNSNLYEPVIVDSRDVPYPSFPNVFRESSNSDSLWPSKHCNMRRIGLCCVKVVSLIKKL